MRRTIRKDRRAGGRGRDEERMIGRREQREWTESERVRRDRQREREKVWRRKRRSSFVVQEKQQVSQSVSQSVGGFVRRQIVHSRPCVISFCCLLFFPRLFMHVGRFSSCFLLFFSFFNFLSISSLSWFGQGSNQTLEGKDKDWGRRRRRSSA